MKFLKIIRTAVYLATELGSYQVHIYKNNAYDTFTEFVLLIRGRKLFGSLRKVMPSSSKNLFIPASKVCGALATELTEGSPSNTITLSAKYVAMMKSCSTTKPVFFACKINLKRREKDE